MIVCRRELLAMFGGGAFAWPLASRAQAVPVVGVLRINPRESEIFAELFRRYMKELGWEEGRNIRFEFVWAGGRNEELPALARDLVVRGVDIVVTFGNPGISAVQRATTTIPIVGMSDDMVREGLAASMARPGGHTTGVSILGAELDLKRLELLHEYVPQARRIAVLKDPTSAPANQKRIESAASRLNLELVTFTVHSADEVSRALSTTKWSVIIRRYYVLMTTFRTIMRAFRSARAIAQHADMCAVLSLCPTGRTG